jgi:hypothetical protein
VAVFSGTLFMTSVGFTALYAWITHDDARCVRAGRQGHRCLSETYVPQNSSRQGMSQLLQFR